MSTESRASSSTQTSGKSNPLDYLPYDMIHLIFSSFHYSELFRIRTVCKMFNHFVLENFQYIREQIERYKHYQKESENDTKIRDEIARYQLEISELKFKILNLCEKGTYHDKQMNKYLSERNLCAKEMNKISSDLIVQLYNSILEKGFKIESILWTWSLSHDFYFSIEKESKVILFQSCLDFNEDIKSIRIIPQKYQGLNIKRYFSGKELSIMKFFGIRVVTYHKYRCVHDGYKNITMDKQ